MYYYRIRGIFSTALTKLVLDHGQCITKPSTAIKNRFPRLSCQVTTPPDAYILDNETKTGFVCKGSVEAVEKLELILKKKLSLPFIIKPLLKPQSIIKAKITKVAPHQVHVDLGNGFKGFFPKKKENTPENGYLLVSIKKQVSSTKRLFEVSRSLNIVGKAVILITHRQRPLFSKFITDEKKKELQQLEISFDEFPFPCTVRWRSAAEDVSVDYLMDEIENLKKTLKVVLEKADEVNVGELLYDGIGEVQVLLSSVDKFILDDIRRQAAPTVYGHHVWKALNPPMADFINYMETILEEDASLESVISTAFGKFVLKQLQEVKTLNIYHWKPTGQYVRLGPFELSQITSEGIWLKRVVHSPGKYDGLNVVKDPGDIIKSFIPTRKNTWSIKHFYYSSSGELKGEYHNINTPPEIGFNNIRYFDLVVDVVKKPNEEPQIIDVEELEGLVSQGLVSSQLKNKILQIAEDLKKGL